ncbi:uncharacterized protein LOC144660237 isoform X2 [Oculina patagonica]
MSVRQLCKRTNTSFSKALFMFPNERRTGIAPTRKIIEKGLDYFVGQLVHVNWDGEKVPAEILALHDDEQVLTQKDNEWCKANYPEEYLAVINKQQPASEEDASEPPRKKVARKKTAANEEAISAATSTESDHPYNEFLAGQKQRESDWKASREAKRAKVQSQTTTPTTSKGDDIQEDLVAVLRQQLTAKTEECRRLMSRLDSLEEVNAKIIKNQSDMQENFLKALENMEDKTTTAVSSLATKLSAILENVQATTSAVSSLEKRLDFLEEQRVNQFTMPHHTTANSEIVDESLVSHEVELPDSQETQDLTTINLDDLSSLHEEEPPELCSPLLPAATTTPVGEELISTCVTPSRIKMVQKALLAENQRHLCALKLLPCFFSKDELATCNTDGSHNKNCLDANKLNSLKILVFSKFPASNSEEKNRAWSVIKSKINTKCRVKRRLAKENAHLQRSL